VHSVRVAALVFVVSLSAAGAPALAHAPGAPARPASSSQARSTATAWIDANASVLKTTNQHIWSYAETGLQEARSSRELMALLQAHGFVVQEGVAGMPTAFVASYGAGKPVIGILAEYDALPGLSQEAAPERKARAGVDSGHGCGHSLFGTGSTGAAIAVKQALAASQASGTIRLYGTPAEETGIGKTYMLRDGLFKDADVVLTWHAADATAPGYAYSKANVSVKFRFSGLAAHASMSPHEGRSALDAVELMDSGVNFMREHIRSDARIHYVITNGGGQPNVVPPEAEVWYYIRADKHADVEKYYAWVQEIAKGAALMTQTTLSSVRVEADMHEMLPNRALSMLIHRNLTAVGAPRFTDEDKAFARATQASLGRPMSVALSETIEDVPAQPVQGQASTDVGDISWAAPVGQLTVASYTFGAPGHSWQIVACTGGRIGETGMLVAAKALAVTALDLMTTPALLEAARTDFDAIRKPLTFVTLIPEGQTAPTTVR
jgi:aminobenzoyl-glutamate utilization protein B